MSKIFFIALLLASASVSSAHVYYVVDELDRAEHAGQDSSFLLEVIRDPQNIQLAAIVGAIILLLFGLIYNSRRIQSYLSTVRHKLSSYHEFIPWIIRLSVGVLLIGSGTTNTFISPILPSTEFFSLLQIQLGFMFLVGFLLVPASIATIILYFIALSQNWYVIGNIETLALVVAFLVFHSARPGIDDVLNISILKYLTIPRKYLALILRIGIGLAMIFLAVFEKFLNPHLSELVVTSYKLTDVINVSAGMWVLGAGIVELLVGICLLFGFYTRLTACIAFIVLSASFFYFKEAVYSHVTLFGLLAALVIEGGGWMSFDSFRQRPEVCYTHPHENDNR